MWMRASLMKAPSSTELSNSSNSNNNDSSSSYTSSSYSSSGYSRHIKLLLSSKAPEERDPKQ